MNPVEETIQKLQSIIDTVETIGMNDVDGWYAASSELHAILPCIPEAFGALSRIFELSAQGINAIVLKTAPNTFAAVEAISKGMNVCKQCLEEGVLCEDLVDPVIQALLQIVSVDTDWQAPLPDDDQDRMMLQMELNDLAMSWVQQEPDEAVGVSRILQSLIAFSGHAGA
jgi:hypothetical protein